jgi:hypothetical protein
MFNKIYTAFETFEEVIDDEILDDLITAEKIGLRTKKENNNFWFWRSDAWKWLNKGVNND